MIDDYAGLIEDAENRRDEDTANALRRLAKLETTLEAGGTHALTLMTDAVGPWVAWLEGVASARGVTRVQALLALADKLEQS